MEEKEKGSRGRPTKSKVRDNIIVILVQKGPMYGYELFKEYKKRFGLINICSIYYNLKKGVSLDLFECKKTEEKEGNYSWGKSTTVCRYSIKTK